MPSYTTTVKHALRWLTGSNTIDDIDAGFQALAEDVDSKLTPYTSGLLSARPVSTGGTPGKAGRLYRATDDTSGGGSNGTLYIDYGTGWLPLMGTDSDLAAIAALATTSFGRSLLTQADAAAARSTLDAISATGAFAAAASTTSVPSGVATPLVFSEFHDPDGVYSAGTWSPDTGIYLVNAFAGPTDAEAATQWTNTNRHLTVEIYRDGFFYYRLGAGYHPATGAPAPCVGGSLPMSLLAGSDYTVVVEHNCGNDLDAWHCGFSAHPLAP